MPDRFRQPLFLRRALMAALFIGLLGAFAPVFFNEGGSMAKLIAKKAQMEMVNEEEVEDYFEAVLYGEGEVGEVPAEAVPEEERRAFVETLFAVDRWVAAALCLGALLLLVPRLLERSPLFHLLPVLSLWLMAEAIGAMVNGGKAHAELSYFAHATRWGLPLVLWGMVWKSRKGEPKEKHEEAVDASSWFVHLAVICTSLTFAVHGWEALMRHAGFQDLIHGFAGLLGLNVTPSVVAVLLSIIGVMDLILAASILKFRKPKLFLWMACWGLITATSRPLTLGMEAWPELAMRSANFILPLLLYLLHLKTSTSLAKPQPEPVPL